MQAKKMLTEGKIALILVILSLILISIGLTNYLFFHVLIELFSIIIAASIGIIAINSEEYSENDFLIFLGIAYIFIALVDLFHTLAYQGMNIFATESPNLATQLWIIARYLEAGTLTWAFLYTRRKLNSKKALISLAIITGILLTVTAAGIFPACFIPGIGLTPFKIISEYVIISLVIFSLYLLQKNRDFFSDRVSRYLRWAFITTILAELAFTLYTDVYGLFNLTGHIFKFVSFFLIYRSITKTTLRKPVETLFYKLKDSNQQLDEKSQQLEKEIKKTKKEIEERKKTERKLKKLQRAVEQNPATIVITDTEGTIEYVNPQFEEITGYTRDEAIGENPRILKSEKHDDEFYKNMWETITAGKNWRGEICNVNKDGEYYWEFASISPLKNKEGEITHFIGIKEDITDRKKMEKKLRQAKKEAERANRSKSEFLAKMSHEIRTPMNGIIGLSELLMKMDIETRQKKYLKMIDNSAGMLLNIINDILDISKIEAGKLELEEQEFHLHREIGNTIETYSIKAYDKGLDLLYEIDPGLPERLIGDPARIKQILINLLGNAIKYTDEGEIYISVKKIRSAGENIELKISVQDTGRGIPQKEQDKLFESFQQLTGNKNNGTGLGLAITRELVEMMDGQIWVDSQPGQGSNFQLTIRLKRAPDSEKKDSPAMEDLEILINVESSKLAHILQRQLSARSISADLEPETGKEYELFICDADRCPENKELRRKTIFLIHPGEREPQRDYLDILLKPVRTNKLINIIQAVADKTKRKDYLSGKKRTDFRPEIQAERKLNILLAEDNHVNQELTTTLLANRNWQYDLAENGREVLDKVDNNSYDLILMDIQMPKMDGLEATRRIRKNGNNTPIIAMTAYALKEDKEKCLQAGMDNYISKPVRAEELYDTITKTISNKNYKQKEKKKFPELDIDLSKTLDNMKGSTKLLQRIIDIFLDNYHDQLKDIEKAISNNNPEKLEYTAHSFKGAVSNFAAPKPYQLALELEKMGKEGKIEKAEEKFQLLKAEVDTMVDYLSSLDPENIN